MTGPRRVMQVAAEWEPLAKVGGLGEAVAGLSDALRSLGWEVEPVLPDYSAIGLLDETVEPLPVPPWAGRVWARHGRLPGFGPVTLIGSPEIRRPHPYLDPATGESWCDNDRRFLTFAAGAAALSALDRPDVIHVHDWHAAATLCLLDGGPPSVLGIHNLAHRGLTHEGWVDRIGGPAEPMRIPGACDPLIGGIRSADAVVTVSPTYRHEICAGPDRTVNEALAARGGRLRGIVNGIDRERWDPATDPRIPHAFDRCDLRGKEACADWLRRRLARTDRSGPIVAVLSRMAHQKGIDLAAAAVPLVAGADGVVVFHGAGQPDVVELTRRASLVDHAHVVVIDGYDETTAHRILAAADILLMPSRFEPCGLTQLQAMRYGTVPVVTDVGGLHDTVVDADRDPVNGTGFVAPMAEAEAVRCALGRALTARADGTRWNRIRARAMAQDWGWSRSARAYHDLYLDLDPGQR